MIYTTDFNYLKRYNENMSHKNKTEAKLNERKSIWKLYCERSTIAETYNLINPESYRIERLIWIVIFVISITYTGSACEKFFEMFSNNLIETVLEDVQFPVYKTRFPAITICNSNHINWNRIEDAKIKFLPQNRSKDTEILFEKFIATFENFRFGFFNNFATQFENESLTDLDHINLNDVLEFLSFRCDELFSTNYCLWRNKKFICCEEFEPQKTIFGHCFTFNSEISINGRQKRHEINYPRRSPGGGPGSGLRFQVNLQLDKKRPENKEAIGLQIICHKPAIWPSGHGVSFSSIALAQTETAISLQPEVYVADKKIMKLNLQQRGCLFETEYHDSDYEYLPGQIYGFGNCLLQCKLRYAQETCGCIPDMSFPASNETKRPCRASDFKCLGAYDKIFKQFTLKNFQSDMPDAPFMKCRCAFTCTKTDYHGKRRYYFAQIDKNFLNVEVFFSEKIMIMFLMTIIFDWSNLLVSFGGIAGLFIGCSVISFVELLYHFYIGLKSCRKGRQIQVKS